MFQRNYRGSSTSGRSQNHQRFNNAARRLPANTHHESMYIKKAIIAADTETYTPEHSFADFPIHENLKANVIRKGYTNPTPIQDKAILPILQGRDVIGIANTGTGKTAAFLIPLLHNLMHDQDKCVLVIVPTRELAQQIQTEMRSLSQSINVYSALCIGGGAMHMQIRELKRNPHIVIGTPGRLKDFAEKRILKLDQFNTIVLDEVDRMLDMGFIHDIRTLIGMLAPERQSLFFSATLSPEIEMIMQKFVKDPVRISVKTQSKTANVEQDVVRYASHDQKFLMLEDILKKEEMKKVLIFGRTKMGVEKLTRNLFQRGFKVASIHGDKPQSKRSQAIRMFEQDIVPILIATDVASRGIDITDITHVINYDQPATFEDYIHRIGRTGRANKAGIALTFVEARQM